MRSVGVAATVFAVSLLRSLADGFGMTDESWFLQVVARMRAGDVLYRDVAYGATPLAVDVTTALSHLIGVELLAVKIVTCAAFGIGVGLADTQCRRLGISAAASWLLAGVLLLVARPYANPPYTPLAMMFFCAALVAAAWMATHGASSAESAPALRACVAAGACAGFSFASKQNVGVLAFGASAASIIVLSSEYRLRARMVLAVTVGFAAAVGTALLPMVLRGGAAGLWDFGFVGKGTYLRVGGVSYLASLIDWLHADAASPRPFASPLSAVPGLVRGAVLILPLIVATVAAWRWRSVDRLDGVLLLFAAAATATAFPRWDRFHMAYAVPVHALTLVSLLKGRTALRVPVVSAVAWRRTMGAASVAVFVAASVPPLAALSGRDGRSPSTRPFLRGVLLSPDAERKIADAAGRLTSAGADGAVLVLGSDAGFWYLQSGLRNPTRFDMPVATAVGRAGAGSLEAAVASGHVPQVCVDSGPPTAKDLLDLRAYVIAHLTRVADIGPCTLFRVASVGTAAAGGRP